MKGDGLGAGIRRSASDQRLAKADIACRSSRANAGFLIATPGASRHKSAISGITLQMAGSAFRRHAMHRAPNASTPYL